MCFHAFGCVFGFFSKQSVIYIHTHCNYISSTCTPPPPQKHTHIHVHVLSHTLHVQSMHVQYLRILSAHKHACTHTHTHTLMHTHTHGRMHAHTHARTTHTHNTHTQHTHTQTHTHKHIHTYTHTQKIIHIHVKCTLTQEGISEHSLGLPKQPGSLDCRQNNSGGPHTQHMLVYTYTRPRDMQVHCSPQCIQTTTFCTITVGTE